MAHQGQGSMDRQVWGPTGLSWSEIFGKYLVLVRVGPRFLKPFRPWSGGRSWSWISHFLGPGPIGFGSWIPAQGRSRWKMYRIDTCVLKL